MRQIYNSESPAESIYTSFVSLMMDGNGNNTITTDSASNPAAVPQSVSATNVSDTNRAINVAASDNGNNRGNHTTAAVSATADLLQCLQNCANASRLSLVNLFPSRLEYTRYLFQSTRKRETQVQFISS